MPERAVVFDFDGVIVDSEAAHEEALVAAAGKVGLSVIRDEQPGRYAGLGDAEAFERIGAANGQRLSEETMRVLIALKGVAFSAIAQTGAIRAYPPTLSLMRALADAGVPTGVCSGSHADDVEPLLESLELLPLVRAVVTADDVKRTKPDPEGYLLAASRLGVPPARCVAVEDSPAGIEAAAAAGYRVVAVCHTFSRERLGGAHEVCERIDDLTVESLLA
ncbi:MAG: HAD family phosphatase [Phycisphaerales bacterium]